MKECIQWFYNNIVNYQIRNPEWMKITGLIKTNFNKHVYISDPELLCKHVDHIALRTVTPIHDMGKLIDKIEGFGYEEKDTYDFPSIDVRAKWYKHKIFPRIFISEHNPYNLDSKIKIIMNEMKEEFRLLTLEEYWYIKDRSQYLAWTLTNGLAFNHVAINLNSLNVSMIEMNGLLLYNDIKLNKENDNYIKKSKDGNLLQSSTLSTKNNYISHNKEVIGIPGPFIEFIERKDGREGFEPENALQIFSSTDTDIN